jgi:glutathione S-transferase
MGLFSLKSKANETPRLICNSNDAGSYKCLFLASFRKIPVTVEWEESSALKEEISESLHLPGLNRFPCVEESDFTVCGTNAVLTYLNIKGKAPTIHPRKARVLAMQQYWIQVLTTKLEPLLTEISNRQKDAATVLEVFDNNLADKNYITGVFSLADIHWAAIFRMLEDQSQSSIFKNYINLNIWLAKIKAEIPGYGTKTEEAAA